MTRGIQSVTSKFLIIDSFRFGVEPSRVFLLKGLRETQQIIHGGKMHRHEQGKKETYSSIIPLNSLDGELEKVFESGGI